MVVGLVMMTMTKTLYLLRWTLVENRDQADETSQNGIPTDPRQVKKRKKKKDKREGAGREKQEMTLSYWLPAPSCLPWCLHAFLPPHLRALTLMSKAEGGR